MVAEVNCGAVYLAYIGSLISAPRSGAFVEFRVLGPLEVVDGDRTLRLGARKQRLLLAVLLCHPDVAVSTDRLVSALWSGPPPASAADNIRVYVHRLRSILGTARIEGRGRPGYAVVAAPEEVDALRFLKLVDRGREALRRGAAEPARQRLAAAIALWRARPFADLEGEPALRELSDLLERHLLAATESRVEADLRLGNDDAVIVEMPDLIARHPYHERLFGQLMTAYYRAGRQAEALETYSRARARLVEELGVEPGAYLSGVHKAILRGDLAQVMAAALPDGHDEGPADSHEDRGTGAVVGVEEDADGRPGGNPGEDTAPPRQPAGRIPAQLPSDLAVFVGREAQLALLDAVCARPAARLAVLSGAAGVGKTSLATRWAHRAGDRFPDGQLYLDLGGYGAGPAVTACEALSAFVRALGVPGPGVPAEERELAALYRSLLAERRVLVVLDNAADIAVVRALLPGSGSCMVVVTSRDPLRGLRALHDAAAVGLEALPSRESVELLRRIIGDADAGHALAEDRLREASDLCARLPLALRIAGANLAACDEPRAAAYLRELRADRFGSLRVEGDDATAVKAAFDLSYAALPQPARQLFRLLGAAPGPHLSRPAIAALAGDPPAVTQPLLTRLLHAGLCDQTSGGHIRMHDLLRCFAVESVDEPAGSSEAALRRLFSFYHRTAIAAAGAAVQGMTRIEHDPAVPGAGPLAFDDAGSAEAWLEAELPNLVATAAAPSATAWQIADALRDYFWARRHGPQWLEIGASALRAAEAAADDRARASAHNNLGIANWALSRYAEAGRHFIEALELERRIGNRPGIAAAASNLGGIHRETGDLTAAFEHCHLALEIYEEIGQRLGAANSRISLAGLAEDLGRLPESTRQAEHALTVYRGLDRADGQGSALLQLSSNRRHGGEFAAAVEAAEQARVLFGRIGARQGEACALHAHSAAAADMVDTDTAARLAEAALILARETRSEQLETEILITLADVARHRGDHAAAFDTATRAFELARGLSLRPVELAALTIQALALCGSGDHANAAKHADQAVVQSELSGYHPYAAKARSILARAQLGAGEHRAAIDTARRALASLEELGYRPWQAQTLCTLAEALDAAGEPDAEGYRRQARAVEAELGIGRIAP